MAGLDRNTVSLLHFDDEAVQFDAAGNAWSSGGPLSFDKSIKKFGDRSLSLDGSCGIQVPYNSKFDFGSGDFTIDFWLAMNNGVCGSGGVGTVIGQNYPGSMLIYFLSGSTIAIGKANIGYDSTAVIPSSMYSDNVFHHYAITRNAGTLKVFVDGTQVASVANTVSYAFVADAQICVGHQTGYNYIIGKLDEYRISNVARYTSNFTPPTEPYTVDTNTLVLLHMEAQTFKDEKGLTLTTTGMPQINSTQSKFGGKSLYLNGSSYLIMQNDFSFGTDDFTIDCWVYCPIPLNDNGIFQFNTSADFNGTHGQLSLWAQGNMFGFSYNGKAQSSTTIVANTWAHVALVRSGSNIQLFVNGVSIMTATLAGQNYDFTHLMLGGYWSTGYLFSGYIDEFRISKGIARWTSNFTPPSRAYTFGGILFKNGSTFYGINSDKTLNNIGSPTTNDDRISLFKNNAMPQSMDNTMIDLIKTNGLKCVAWDADTDSSYNSVVAAVPKAQFIHEAFDIDLKLASYIDWVHVNDGVSNFEAGNGKIRMIVSRDSGSTWQTYNITTSKWDTVLDTSNTTDGAYDTVNTKRFIPSEDAMTRLLASGMNVTTFNAAPFNDFTLAAGYKTLRVGYILSIDSSSDVAMSDSLKYQYDGVGDWVLGANWTHYKVQTRNNSHTLTWLSPINGTRVKVNY